MKTRNLIRWSLLVAPVVLGLTGRIAQAQTGDAALARQLFTDGRKLASLGQYAQACPKFEESARQSAGIGTLFNLADCWEHLGQTASAWARFLEAAALAGRAGQPEREKAARDRAALLEPKLSRLTLNVQSTASDLAVTRNGTVVNRPAWGTAVPMDPGTYSIAAKAPGRKAFQATVKIEPNGGNAVVVVPELDRDVAEVASVPISPASPAHPAAPAPLGRDEPAPRESSSTRRVLGVATVGLGIGGIVTGVVFGLKARSNGQMLAGICPSGTCLRDEADYYQRVHEAAVNSRTFSVLGFALGGAALVGGTILIALPSPDSATAGIRRSLWMRADATQVQLGAAW